MRRGTTFSSPGIARNYLRLMLGTREHEVFVVVTLDLQHRLIEVIEMFRGTIDAAAVYPREVVKEMISRTTFRPGWQSRALRIAYSRIG